MPRSSVLRALAFALAFGGPVAAQATPALVVDAGNGAVLFAEDAGDPWYPASTAKLMTAFVTFEALRDGRVDLQTPVVISRNAMREASLHAGLEAGRAMTLRDALFAVIAGSANEVAVALAETVAGSTEAFVARMNEAAGRLGMTASRFANPNGLGDPAQQVTARDLALLALAIDRDFPEHRAFFRAGGVAVDGVEVPSYNDLLARYPGAVGMKTGFLCTSGRNIVALAERDGRRILVVLLGATTERERGERSARFLTEAFEGALQPKSVSVDAIANRADVKPEDMRLRLCSDQSAAYEAERDRLYPMGLPGEASYLGPPAPVPLHAIATWAAPVPVDVPVPTPRPAA